MSRLKHKDLLNLARKYFPKTTDEDLDFILWEYTGYPNFFIDKKEVEKQLKQAKKELNK